jgi:tetratricopeptide (TPR) repeat protein
MLDAMPGRRSILLAATLAACTPALRRPPGAPARARAKPAAAQRLEMEPIKLVATGGGENVRVEVLDASGLFEHAGRLLSQKKHKEALAVYDRLLRHFPGSRLVSPALYNAGLAHEWRREFDRAALRYRELQRRFGATKEAIDAAFRLGGCYAELRNWAASAQVFAELARRKDLSASDRIEALTRRGLALFRMGDARGSRGALREALEFWKSVEAQERLETDFFVAMARYYLAALPHVEFRNAKVDSGAQMGKTLDDKARLLLLAQAGYIETIKAKNPYWATAAGFQIGSLYKEFYTTLLTTLPDFKAQAAKNAKATKLNAKAAEEQLVQVYLEEVHKAVKPLLTKAIRVFEKTVLVAERVGVQSEWVQKSQHQMNELKHLLGLPPKDAVKLVTQDRTLPEDQKSPPAPATPAASQPTKKDPGDPDKAPARPGDSPADPDEPGRVIL